MKMDIDGMPMKNSGMSQSDSMLSGTYLIISPYTYALYVIPKYVF